VLEEEDEETELLLLLLLLDLLALEEELVVLLLTGETGELLLEEIEAQVETRLVIVLAGRVTVEAGSVTVAV